MFQKKTGNAAAMGAAFIIATVALLLSSCEDITGGGPQSAERPVISAYPEGYTVSLNGEAAPLTVTASVSDGGTLSYQWRSAGDDTTADQAIAEATAASYTPPVNAPGSRYYYVVVTNTNAAAAGQQTTAVASNRAKVEVRANLAVYTAVQSGGVEGETDSTAINFSFDKNIGALNIADITVTDGSGSVAKGEAVTKNPESNTWTLPVTVNSAGNVVVHLTKDGIESVPRTVAVYKNPNLKTGNSITKFKVGDVEGDIDETAKAITIVIPADQADFTVAVTISPGATVVPLQAERNGVSVYRVTAENGTTADYTVTKLWLGGGGLELTGGPFGGTDGTGGITVTSPNTAWPDNVTRSADGGGGGLGANAIILTASDKTCDSYRWYVDGGLLFFYNSDAPSPIGPVVDHLAGGNYSVGQHVLVLIAVKNGVPYTVRQVFTVKA
jgi:hypothetical protein